MIHNVQDNKATARFELRENDALAFAAYKTEDGALFINYVEAAPALRGTGAASRLMESIATEARAAKLKVVPICGYAASWFRRHPTYADVLSST